LVGVQNSKALCFIGAEIVYQTTYKQPFENNNNNEISQNFEVKAKLLSHCILFSPPVKKYFPGIISLQFINNFLNKVF